MNDTDPRRSDAPVPAARTRGQALDFRPTLFGEEAPGEAGAGTDGLRILGSLQSPPAPHRGSPRGRWILGGLLAAALMASGGLALRHAAQATDAAHGEGGGPAAEDTDLTARHPSSAGPAASMPAVPASAWPPAPAASMGEVELPPAAARIEADTPSAARDPFAGLAPTPTPTPTQAQAQAQARTQAAETAASAVAVPAPTPAQVAGHAQPGRLARAEPSREVAVRPAQAAVVQPGRRAGDEDVELIEAVVSHGAGRKRAPPPAARASAGARGGARDVVQRQASADSTTELLQRCDAVGGLEGVLCRWRICADRWGQDPACPKNTQRPYREPS